MTNLFENPSHSSTFSALKNTILFIISSGVNFFKSGGFENSELLIRLGGCTIFLFDQVLKLIFLY